MAQIDESVAQEMRNAAAQALVGAQDDKAMMAAAAISVDDVGKFFCDNWPMIKQVLQLLAGKLGAIGFLVRALIAAGDALYRSCPLG